MTAPPQLAAQKYALGSEVYFVDGAERREAVVVGVSLHYAMFGIPIPRRTWVPDCCMDFGGGKFNGWCPKHAQDALYTIQEKRDALMTCIPESELHEL